MQTYQWAPVQDYVKQQLKDLKKAVADPKLDAELLADALDWFEDTVRVRWRRENARRPAIRLGWADETDTALWYLAPMPGR